MTFSFHYTATDEKFRFVKAENRDKENQAKCRKQKNGDTGI